MAVYQAHHCTKSVERVPVQQASYKTDSDKIDYFIYFLFQLLKKTMSENNDFIPVVLTSIVKKCFEKYVVSILKTEVDSMLDPFQSAYRPVAVH